MQKQAENTENTENTERQKTGFPKEQVDNADLSGAVLNKVMSTQHIAFTTNCFNFLFLQ